jgi:hypothetical protein
MPDRSGAATPIGSRRVRVLHCPFNIGGHASGLAAAERKLGFDARSVTLSDEGYGFAADEALSMRRKGRIAVEIARIRLIWRAIAWADVVHFYFGQTCLTPHPNPGFEGVDPFSKELLKRTYARMLWMRDLPVLRLLKKPIFMTWQGDDARQHDRSLELFDQSIAHEMGDHYYAAGSDEWKRRAIRKVSGYAFGQFALNPDLLEFLPKSTEFLPYASFEPGSVKAEATEHNSRRPLRVVHAPSHRGAKGTRHIVEAVQSLQSKGFVIELDLVEGLSRQAALQRYRDADVAVDQLLAGWYGGFAVETMAIAKPVICYLRDRDLQKMSAEFRADIPIVNASATDIEGVLASICRMESGKLMEIGRRSRRFAEKWHDPSRAAAITTQRYLAALGQ